MLNISPACELPNTALPATPNPCASIAWLSYDAENLYLGVRNEVDPKKPLRTGSAWGADDAVEVAIRKALGL